MFNPQQLLRDLDAIFLTWPELAEDEELRNHVLTKGTDFHAALTICLEEMRHAETLSEAIDIRRRELTARKSRMDRKSEAMRALMQKLMEHANEKKAVLPEATLSLRSIPPSVIVEDQDALPQQYLRWKAEPNKALIKSDLDSGVSVPGAVLSNGGVGLSVRCK